MCIILVVCKGTQVFDYRFVGSTNSWDSNELDFETKRIFSIAKIFTTFHKCQL
jgi:hypothetical protein